MTRDRGFKRLVRARMQRTGESYATARAHLRRGRQPSPARDGGALTFPTDHPAPVLMTRRELAALPDADLVARCAAPISKGMRVLDAAARHAFLRQLTGAQGALLAFWIVLTHAETGLSGFCAGYPHRMVDDDFWTLLDAGLAQIGDHDLRSLVRRLRTEVAAALTAGGYGQDLGGERDLDEETFGRLLAALERLDPEVMRQLDDEYQRVLPGSLVLAAQLVRDHANEFVSIEA